MRTLAEHEDFYVRIASNAEKVLDKIEAKLDKGEAISTEVAADLAMALSCMMKAEAKVIMGMREHHGHVETL
jgi:hypothetical protein